MRICIDISQIVYGTGVSHYRKHLAGDIPQIDTENEYVLFGGSLRRINELKEFASTVKGRHDDKFFRFPPTLADIVWNKLHILPIENLVGKIDVLHTSDWAEPPSKAFKITTIHDLIPLRFPKMTPSSIFSAHKDRLKWVAKESRRIIVPSDNTRKDLIDLGFDEKIIRVIPEAANLSVASKENVDKVKKKYGIFDDYLLSIGTKPWKNTKRMIEAFHLSKHGRNLKFIVVGETKDTDFRDERGVRFLGFVPDEDLSALLTGSEALIFASIYEGFGIPILDAFNCGVPVVTSNVGSMKEVAGDAAALVDPTDIGSISDGIQKVLKGPKGWVEKGSEKVKSFSWAETARKTLSVYNESK